MLNSFNMYRIFYMNYGTNDEQKLIKTNDANINCDINLLNCKEIMTSLM